MRLNRALSFLTLALACSAAAPLAAQTTRQDQPLRDTMTVGFRNAATQHRVTADLPTLGLTSTGRLLAGAVAVPPANGIEGMLRGEPFALAYIDGVGADVARGYYRLELDGDGNALLLTASGAAVGRGDAQLDLVANPGTSYCHITIPNPDDDDIVCWNCIYGNPSFPGGAWAVNTCFKLWDPFD